MSVQRSQRPGSRVEPGKNKRVGGRTQDPEINVQAIPATAGYQGQEARLGMGRIRKLLQEGGSLGLCGHQDGEQGIGSAAAGAD